MRHSELTITIFEKPKNDNEALESAMITMLYICKNAYSVFKSSKTPLKHLLLKSLFSNCLLNGANPRCVMVRPLSGVLKHVRCLKWQGLLDEVRTNHEAEVISLHQHLPDQLRCALQCDEV